VQLFYQFWPHTQVIRRMGVLDRWVQTPSNHRVHHAQNSRYLDKNYVGVFLIWDRIFGTFQDELDEDPCIFGIRGQLKSWNPVWANLHYYWAMAKDSWHARSWADKARVWIAPPGWRPADVEARFPKSAYDPHRDFHRFDPERNASISWYAFVQFVALIAMSSHFLKVLPKQSMPQNFSYFLVLLAGLTCLGGLLENRRVWLRLEAIRLSIVGAGVVATGAWFGGVTDPASVAGISGFTAISLLWLGTAMLAPTTKKAANLAA